MNSIYPAQASPFLSPQPTRVISVKVECKDTVSLRIESPTGYPAWQPGQFNMLYLFGIGEVPISISGSSLDTTSLTHTVKSVGPVSKAITELLPGDTIWLRGPFGSAWPKVSYPIELLVIGGGIGLAPLRSVILSVIADGSFARLTVLYGSRTPLDLMYSDDLAQWRREPKVEIHVAVDRTYPELSWSGSVGVVTQYLQHLRVNPAVTLVMTCGPEVMMRHAAADLANLGVPDCQIYVSIERNMKCAVGICGRCQWGPYFVCKDGPIYQLDQIRKFWSLKEF